MANYKKREWLLRNNMGEVIEVKVKPNSPKNEVLGEEHGYLRVNLKAPAQDGKANIELIKFLSKHFKKHATIISGRTSKIKKVRLE